MKVKYEAQKGQRINKGTFKIKGHKNRHKYFCMFECISKDGTRLWWNYTYHKWIKYEDWNNNGNISSSCGLIDNVKKAIRHLKKHNEIPVGTTFALRCRFKGYDVYITK